MTTILLDQLDDSRVSVFQNLRDRDVSAKGPYFIGEGPFILEKLLASSMVIESILLSTRKAEKLIPQIPSHVPIYVAPDALIHQIVGFDFHSGILACGQRPPNPTLESFFTNHSMPNRTKQANHNPTLNADHTLSHRQVPSSKTLLICPYISNHENLGSMIRTASGFGVDGVILGPSCSDPWYRRAVRVSMGTIFHMPIRISEKIEDDIKILQEKYHVQCVATVADGCAISIAKAVRPTGLDRLALLLGAEDYGLPKNLIAQCNQQVTIPMQRGTDSLNVAIAAAIFLYHYTLINR